MASFPYFTTFHSNNDESENNELLKFNSLPSSYLFQHTHLQECNENVVEHYQNISSNPDGNPRYLETLGKSIHSKGKKPVAHPAKKVVHKVTERQRRKDMNSLCSELRSLLPQESLKGKRSLSDQVLEAVNYVRYLENQIKDLTKQRDDINTRAVCYKGVNIPEPLQLLGSDEGFPSVKIISLGSATFQVTINALKSQIALSDVAVALEEARLEILSASFSSISESVFITVHTKASYPKATNMEGLYVKLRHLIM
ncbi:transcription factor bHLH36-like [Cryptomeria japonica]|uniref:transcription factor bHLH36-like n=1 Tax=Cryptomeria japonica TaxID=3369 RepID=UPI0025AC1A33|nr:transcription factor bHLH36-like [Cryptomeria japonica]